MIISGQTVSAGLLLDAFDETDYIDLASVPFVPGGTASIISGSTLDILEAGKHYDLNFDDFLGPVSGHFLLGRSQFDSGTEITLAKGPIVSSGSSATVSAGESSSDVTVNGGTQIVEAGGTADGTMVRAGGIQQIAADGTASGTLSSEAASRTSLGRISMAPSTTAASRAFWVAGSRSTRSSTIPAYKALVRALPPAVCASAAASRTSFPAGLRWTPGWSRAVPRRGCNLLNLAASPARRRSAPAGSKRSWPAAPTSPPQSAAAEPSACSAALRTISSKAAAFRSSAAAALFKARSSAAAKQDVFGSAVGTSVGTGGVLAVESGGGAASVTVGAGGTLVILGGGSASYSIASGATLEIGSGVVLSGIIVSDGMTLEVSGGTAVAAAIQPFGQDLVVSGGLTSGTIVSSGGTEIVSQAGLSISAILQTSGEQIVASGGTAIGTTIASAAEQVISAGGTGLNSEIGAAGSQTVYGLSISTTVDAGGEQFVSSGGTAVAAQLSGTQEVRSGAVGLGALLRGENADLEIAGFVSGTFVSSGTVRVFSGGIDSGATINSAGTQFIFAGGEALGAILIGGTQFVSAGGFAGGTIGGTQIIESGGTSLAAGVGAGGLLDVLSGAVTSNAIISGGSEFVSGGLDIGATLLDGGGRLVESGGRAISATVASGGVDFVLGHGLAIGTIVQSGGTEFIASAGTASASRIVGGTEVIAGDSAGGLAIGATVLQGGLQVISAGGTAVGTIISFGGREIISAAGTANATTIRGGTAEIADGGSVGSSIAFAGGGGTLQIDGTATPSATISGFVLGDVIDLADLAFSGGTAATLTSGGVLVVTEGATTRMVQLDPAHNYASQSFALSADAGSGTDVRALVPLFVSSAGFVPTSGPLRAGQSITITLHLNEHPVTVAGAPKLRLSNGAFAAYVAAASSPSSGTLVFKYTVSAGQDTSDLQIAGVVTSGASVKDTTGSHNSADFSYVPNSDLGLAIDTRAPSITNVRVTVSSGGTAVGLGGTVAIELQLSEAVVVSGTPTLKLSDGGTAVYVSGGSSNPASGSLEFDYTVGSGQNTADLTISSLSLLSGATITDSAGNPVNPTLPAAGKNLHLTIDSIRPSVTSATIAPSSGTISNGGTAVITLKLSEAVTVSGGTPVLDLNDGGTAIYAGGAGTTSLTFDYVVGSETAADLRITGIENAATVTDSGRQRVVFRTVVRPQAGRQRRFLENRQERQLRRRLQLDLERAAGARPGSGHRRRRHLYGQRHIRGGGCGDRHRQQGRDALDCQRSNLQCSERDRYRRQPRRRRGA